MASKDADLVIGAGDFANHREDVPEALNLLTGIKAPFVAVPGNNESDKELRDAAHIGTTVLHGEGTEIAGLQVFGIGCGIPATPWSWSFDMSDEEAATILAGCDAADILVTHSPPKGVVDEARPGVHFGSQAIHGAILRIRPKLVFCGHIHESWGKEGWIGDSRVINLGPNVNWFEL